MAHNSNKYVSNFIAWRVVFNMYVYYVWNEKSRLGIEKRIEKEELEQRNIFKKCVAYYIILTGIPKNVTTCACVCT